MDHRRFRWLLFVANPMAAAPPARSSLPAWALSLAVHAVLLLLVGLALRRTPPAAEPSWERPAGIVLARGEPEAVRYFDQFEQPEADAAGAAGGEQAALPPAAAAAAAAAQLDQVLPQPARGFGQAVEHLLADPLLQGAGRRSLPDADGGQGESLEPARRPGPAGPQASLSLFGGSPARGNSFLFLIDRSKSMGGSGLNALAAAERELARAVSALGPEHRFQIVAYNQRCVFLANVRRLLPATEENKQAIHEFFAGLAAFGGTEHYLALQMALTLRPDVIYVLTDGGEPHMNQMQLSQIGREAAGRTVIHCVQFGFGPLQDRDPFLRRLAALTGGGYRYVQL